MIFTELSYIEFGKQILTPSLLIFFACVIIYRYVLAFHHYIYHGDFGDYEKTAFGQCMEGNGLGNVIKYGFTGYHPAMISLDAIAFAGISMISALVWGPLIFIILLMLLGYFMRKRIATKQEFVARLNGEYHE